MKYLICCKLAPLLFNIFFAAVINAAYTRFKADKDLMNALVHLSEEEEHGGGGAGGSNQRRASRGGVML